MRVHVTIPPFWKWGNIDERGWIELPEGAKLSDVLGRIRMPKLLAQILMVSVNGAVSRPEKPLADGDSIVFIPIVTGG
jgi:molybdopterin converting factor small subunit